MSGYPAHHDYDDGYGHQPAAAGNTDSYYENEQGQYYDNNAAYDAPPAAGGAHPPAHDGYYDES